MKTGTIKKLRYLIILIIVAAAAVLVAVRVRSISHGPAKSEAAETRLVLNAMEEQDIEPIQEEIDLRRSVVGAGTDLSASEVSRIIEETEHSMPSLDELEGYNYKQIFSNCVVMGDSIANQLTEYDILTDAEVIAEDGMNVAYTDGQIEAAAALHPGVVFLTYGLNDMELYLGNTDYFRDDYDDFLERVQDALPDASIYVALILPVNDSALDRQEAYQNREEYNQMIMECCSAHEIPYMDLDFTLPDEYFDEDGIHPRVSFYYGWLYCMAKGAGLL